MKLKADVRGTPPTLELCAEAASLPQEREIRYKGAPGGDGALILGERHEG